MAGWWVEVAFKWWSQALQYCPGTAYIIDISEQMEAKIFSSTDHAPLM